MTSSGVIKRSVNISGRNTSISLEEPFWLVLKEIAAVRKQSVSSLVATINVGRAESNLSSALRVFVFDEIRSGRFGRYTSVGKPIGSAAPR